MYISHALKLFRFAVCGVLASSVGCQLDQTSTSHESGQTVGAQGGKYDFTLSPDHSCVNDASQERSYAGVEVVNVSLPARPSNTAAMHELHVRADDWRTMLSTELNQDDVATDSQHAFIYTRDSTQLYSLDPFDMRYVAVQSSYHVPETITVQIGLSTLCTEELSDFRNVASSLRCEGHSANEEATVSVLLEGDVDDLWWLTPALIVRLADGTQQRSESCEKVAAETDDDGTPWTQLTCTATANADITAIVDILDREEPIFAEAGSTRFRCIDTREATLTRSELYTSHLFLPIVERK